MVWERAIYGVIGTTTVVIRIYNVCLRMSNRVSQGVVHRVPHDLRRMLIGTKDAYDTWQDITPIARNEWICWIEDAKQADTRARRIRIAGEQLAAGKRRPCCWPGCPHRT